MWKKGARIFSSSSWYGYVLGQVFQEKECWASRICQSFQGLLYLPWSAFFFQIHFLCFCFGRKNRFKNFDYCNCWIVVGSVESFFFLQRHLLNPEDKRLWFHFLLYFPLKKIVWQIVSQSADHLYICLISKKNLCLDFLKFDKPAKMAPVLRSLGVRSSSLWPLES